MVAPRFSIVIPTRERPHTLEDTLATCTSQEGDLEIVVSDNFGGPRTREIVERCGDERVRYVRTPSLLAMTDSLEFAVAQARGEFVIIQGDDDGLLAHAVPVIDTVLRETGATVLRWDCAVYNWPDLSNPHFRPNALLLPLTQTRRGHELVELNARDTIRAAANGRASYSDLPVIYNAVVRRDLFAALRARTGRAFKTRTPDVYGAFAVAALVDTYFSLRAPLGVCGRSGASTGVARHFCKKGSPVDTDFRRLNEAAGLHLHPWVPDVPPIASAVADAFLWARAELFPGDADTTLDRAELVRNCLREMEIDTAAEWDEARASFRAALADAPDLLAWFEREYGARPHDALDSPNRRHHWRRYGEGYLHLDAADFGARTVADVCALCERLLGYRAEGLPYARASATNTGPALSELQEKEACIQRLAALCQSLQAQLQATGAHPTAAAPRPRASRLETFLRKVYRKLVPRRAPH
ncbi:MAG: glycosyltransferase family 2 protein [Planctomycetes bacterium]|nr:glycosyltransferase family 2 protein [Planctomycetota bacterium]